MPIASFSGYPAPIELGLEPEKHDPLCDKWRAMGKRLDRVWAYMNEPYDEAYATLLSEGLDTLGGGPYNHITTAFLSAVKRYAEGKSQNGAKYLNDCLEELKWHNFPNPEKLQKFVDKIVFYAAEDSATSVALQDYLDSVHFVAPEGKPFKLLRWECYHDREKIRAIQFADPVLRDFARLCSTWFDSNIGNFDLHRCQDFVNLSFDSWWLLKNRSMDDVRRWQSMDVYDCRSLEFAIGRRIWTDKLRKEYSTFIGWLQTTTFKSAEGKVLDFIPWLELDYFLEPWSSDDESD